MLKCYKSCIFLMCICILLNGCSSNVTVDEVGQLRQTNYNGGQLYLQIETNKVDYSYDEYIYITATLINKGKKTIEIIMNTDAPGPYQPITVSLFNGDDTLVDVDLHKQNVVHSKESLVLNPGESYVQNMRFSTRSYKGPTGNEVKTENIPASGEYIGCAIVNIVTGDETTEVKVDFSITVRPES